MSLMTGGPTTRDGSYSKAMAHAADVYGDVLAALRGAGYRTEMTQTGGMCLAILVSIQGVDTVLITDKDEILPWDREDHRGWRIGLYVNGETEPTMTADTDDGSLAMLVSKLAQLDLL